MTITDTIYLGVLVKLKILEMRNTLGGGQPQFSPFFPIPKSQFSACLMGIYGAKFQNLEPKFHISTCVLKAYIVIASSYMKSMTNLKQTINHRCY